MKASHNLLVESRCSKQRRVIGACLTALVIMTSCAHQNAAKVIPVQTVPAPAVAPVQAPPGPRPAQSQEVNPAALSMQLMAGNIEPLHGDDPILPEEVLSSSRGQVLEGAYKVCISSEGSVQSVTPVMSIEGADPCIIETLKAWRFPKLPLMVCKVQTLRFEIP
jgi:hypothetical protein